MLLSCLGILPLLGVVIISKLNSYGEKHIFIMLPPKPHKFVNTHLKSGLELSDIISQTDLLLPQLSKFIDQFNILINSNNINVITDGIGNLSIDAPINMPDEQAQDISRRIGILDRLITTRSQEIHNLLQEGLNIKNSTKNSEHSVILEKLSEYNKLKDSYRH
jgi:hypothetical protein